MAIAHAMWTHGHSMQIEFPDRVSSVRRTGFSIRVESKSAQSNWFHFAIPTPVIVDANRLRAEAALVRFKSVGGDRLKAVHVYDGERKIASKEKLNLQPAQWHVEKVSIPKKPEILWGVGISVLVEFGIDGGATEFSAAGCDFLP